VIRAAAGALALAAVLAAPSCAAHSDVHAKVCVDAATRSPDTYTRLADKACESGQAHARWRYYGESTHIPRVGQGAPRSGSFTEPAGSLVRIPAAGATARDQCET
jgi:hypothetical protein